MNYLSNKSQLPIDKHFAALVFDYITIPGDERSRTNPGHGYPEHTESVIKYITFASKVDMEQWVSKQETSPYGRKDNYKVIEVVPLNVKLKVVVE
jgi:hypothetical protein